MQIVKTDITNIGDPFILPYMGVYYHYSTSSPHGFLLYTSSDLHNWECQGLCYKDSRVGYKDFWAPEVYYHNNKFYMFFTAKNKDREKLMLNVAVSDSPMGPFVDISDKPTFDFGYAAIDATVFKDDDGSFYMYYVRDCSENIVNGIHTSQIYVVRLKDCLTETDGEPKMILTPSGELEQKDPLWQWNEGPAVLKHNGKYYVCYSINFFADKRYSVCYATSESPYGPFTKFADNPILSFTDDVSGPGHNSFFKTFDGKCMTAFHIHTDYANPSGNRRTCFAQYYFKDDRLCIY